MEEKSLEIFVLPNIKEVTYIETMVLCLVFDLWLTNCNTLSDVDGSSCLQDCKLDCSASISRSVSEFM